jgi:hypothetical protein
MNRMKSKMWLIFLTGLVVVLLASSVGVTSSAFTDQEDSSNNRMRVITNWYDFTWHWRKPITINNSGGALTNYQVKVVINTQELIAAGKMQSDGDDIRFTRSDKVTEIPYWIESGINTASTIIWVKVPSIPGGNSNIYIYYGNPAAAGASSGTATFIIFGDKNATAGWTRNNITVETSGDFLRFYNPTATNVGYAVRYDLTSPTTWSLEAQFKNESLGASDQVVLALLDGNIFNRFTHTISPHWAFQNKCGYYDGAEHEIGTNLWAEGTEYIFIHRVDESNSSTGVDFYVCNTSRTILGSAGNIGFAAGAPTDMDGIAIGDAANNATCDVYFRWIFLRNYTTVTVIGTEE